MSIARRIRHRADQSWSVQTMNVRNLYDWLRAAGHTAADLDGLEGQALFKTFGREFHAKVDHLCEARAAGVSVDEILRARHLLRSWEQWEEFVAEMLNHPSQNSTTGGNTDATRGTK